MSARVPLLRTASTYVLDFDVSCHKCEQDAVAYLEIHAVDRCTPEARTMANFMCRACLDVNLGRAQAIILDGEVWCSSCGRFLVTLSDLVVRLEKIA